jgi:hypothetical protein
MAGRKGDAVKWRDAVGGFEGYLSADLQRRYSKALDLLTLKVGKSVWDFDAGIWVKPSGSVEQTRLALAVLAHDLVIYCEEARSRPDRKRPSKSDATERRMLRRKLATQLKKTSNLLEEAAAEIPLNSLALREAAKWIRTSPEHVFAPPATLNTTQREIWNNAQRGRPERLALSSLFHGLMAIASGLDTVDKRRSSGSAIERPDTALAVKLVTQLRVATGAQWHYQDDPDDNIPRGGKPHYAVVVAFLHAALPASANGKDEMVTAEVIENRLKVRQRRR